MSKLLFFLEIIAQILIDFLADSSCFIMDVVSDEKIIHPLTMVQVNKTTAQTYLKVMPVKHKTV